MIILSVWILLKKDLHFLLLSEKGFGKRVPYNNFVNKGRGGKGMTYLKITDKNGKAAGIRSVLPDDEIIITSVSGMTIRLLAKDISSQGRSTVGIKLLELN